MSPNCRPICRSINIMIYMYIPLYSGLYKVSIKLAKVNKNMHTSLYEWCPVCRATHPMSPWQTVCITGYLYSWGFECTLQHDFNSRPLEINLPERLHWTCCQAYRAPFIISHDTPPPQHTHTIPYFLVGKNINPAYMALKAAFSILHLTPLPPTPRP